MMTNQICPADDVTTARRCCGMKQTCGGPWCIDCPEYRINVIATEDNTNETKEQYDARIKAKIERRTQLGQELSDMANKKKQEEDRERHWTDRIKPWPGAHGSYYMLKL